MKKPSRPFNPAPKSTVRPRSKSKGAVPPDLVDAVRQWWGALESWHGVHFLIEPQSISRGDELLAVLQQWWGALESWQAYHFLIKPPDSYSGADELKALLQQWHGALEARRGMHFLTYPA